MKLRIGTRGSALALFQARHIATRLEALDHETEIIIVKTKGDNDQVRPFAQVGEPGLFVREIEVALIEERIDVAVHCYKDLPSDSPAELIVSAMPEREDTRDRLLIAARAYDESAEGLPLVQGAHVGTASARRQALVRHLRPDLKLGLLRGNVPTRVRKLAEGEFDAILLASAGLARLDRAHEKGEGPALDRGETVELDLDPRVFVPAPSQGALALQTRVADETVRAAIDALDDTPAHRAVSVERDLLAMVDAGCQVPFGAYCELGDNDEFELHAALEVAGELRRAVSSGSDAGALARTVFQALLPEGVRPR